MTWLARTRGRVFDSHIEGDDKWIRRVSYTWLAIAIVTLDLDPVDRGRSTVGGLDPRRYCASLCIMLCDSGCFLEGWVRRGPPVRVAQGGLVSMPELVTCLCICCVSLSWCMYVFLKSSGVVTAPMRLDSLRLSG
ncbi:hypothetical protein M9H77_23092 [Catharanthus roseus]|uniref:Uncharacterized protein n=1 Tax=Catharanthus roseus TaxID=4058 RepID=A0ACC0AT94_CATRO|nr:hypothetical protein M9H77_23092 [Catharanthus roseus]